jgi:hypothetical protein
MFGDRKTHSEKSLENRGKRKEILCLLLGGKCVRCGIEGPYAIYDFHHIDEKDKKFTIALKMNCGYDEFENVVIPEVRENCMLLCSNCHRILHTDKKERLLIEAEYFSE